MLGLEAEVLKKRNKQLIKMKKKRERAEEED